MVHQLHNIEKEMIDMRRYMHMNPELSFEETNTVRFITNYLEKLGIPYKKNVGGGGIVATIKGIKPGKTVALRADFDALPISDEKDVPYKSQVPNVMHACGHDAHTASLLGVANVVSQNTKNFNGEIRLIFQHAEELQPGGAIGMIEDGCLDGVDAIFGNHMASKMPIGKVGYISGPAMAASATYEITIKGAGGHGAYPHTTIDPIVIGANVVQKFQQIVSRRINPLNPAVVTVGKFIAGTAFNIIPDTAFIGGTVRVYDVSVQEKIHNEMDNILKGLCTSSGATYDFFFNKGYPAVINTKEETKIVKEAFDILGLDSTEMEPRMGAEDFSYYLQKVPGSFFSTGAGNESEGIIYPHHHPKFDIDEKSILIASKALLQSALVFLSK